MLFRLSSAALCLVACTQGTSPSEQRSMSAQERVMFDQVTNLFTKNIAAGDSFRVEDLPFKAVLKDCDVDFQTPQKKGVGAESGYFYLIVGSSRCPLRFENRVSVIHAQPEGRVSFRTALTIVDSEKAGELKSYEAEGVLALIDFDRGYRVSGTLQGVIYQEPKIKFEIVIDGDVTSGYVSLDREIQISFPSFTYTSKSLNLLNFNLSKPN